MAVWRAASPRQQVGCGYEGVSLKDSIAATAGEGLLVRPSWGCECIDMAGRHVSSRQLGQARLPSNGVCLPRLLPGRLLHATSHVTPPPPNSAFVLAGSSRVVVPVQVSPRGGTLHVIRLPRHLQPGNYSLQVGR